MTPERGGGDIPRQRREADRTGGLRRGWRTVKNRRCWSGFVLGVVTGAVVAALLFALLPAVFAAPDDLEPGELVILSGRDDSAGGQRQALVDQWNALHPRNPARIEELPAETDAQRTEMVARAESGQNPVDIYNLDVITVAEFAEEGYLRPLRETPGTTGFLDGPMDTCWHEGELWALPFNSDAGLLFRRTDLVPDSPGSWDAMNRQIRALFGATSGRADPRLEAGYAGQLASYEGLTVNALEAIWAAGGDVVDDDGRVVIDTRETREALRWLASVNDPADPTILSQSREFTETTSTNAFRDGRVAFLRMWPVAYRSLRPTPGDQPAGADELPFEVGRLPGPSVLGGQDLAIAKGTERPRAAQALIEFLTSERSQQLLFERGGFAATREVVYRDAEVIKSYPYATALLDAVRAARPRPVTRHYVRFSEEFRRIVEHALANGGQLPPDAPQRLQDALRGY